MAKKPPPKARGGFLANLKANPKKMAPPAMPLPRKGASGRKR
jgi:hypothetical protein